MWIFGWETRKNLNNPQESVRAQSCGQGEPAGGSSARVLCAQTPKLGVIQCSAPPEPQNILQGTHKNPTEGAVFYFTQRWKSCSVQSVQFPLRCWRNLQGFSTNWEKYKLILRQNLPSCMSPRLSEPVLRLHLCPQNTN